MRLLAKKISEKYNIDAVSLIRLLEKMELFHFRKGEYIVRSGLYNPTFYLIKEGIWRASYQVQGIDYSLWFASDARAAFSSYCYFNGFPSRINLTSETDSVAYGIPRWEVEQWCLADIDIANLMRVLCERCFSDLEREIFYFTNIKSAKERYKYLLITHPELVQKIPLKNLASYFLITPQSLSRIRKNLGDTKDFKLDDFEKLMGAK